MKETTQEGRGWQKSERTLFSSSALGSSLASTVLMGVRAFRTCQPHVMSFLRALQSASPAPRARTVSLKAASRSSDFLSTSSTVCDFSPSLVEDTEGRASAVRQGTVSETE